MNPILQDQREALLERCQRRSGTVVLAHDWTAVHGLDLHAQAAAAFTEGQLPLGVSGVEFWAGPLGKPSAEKEDQRWFWGLEQGFELARACPGTQVVVAGDKEGGIYNLFRRHSKHGEAGVELLARVDLDRRKQANVWDSKCRKLGIRPLPDQPDFVGQVHFEAGLGVRSQRGRMDCTGRAVETEVRIGAVEVQPPKAPRQRGEKAVGAWLVNVKQTNAGRRKKPLEWLLASTAGGMSKRWARRIAGWYEARCGTAECFRVLNSSYATRDRMWAKGEDLDTRKQAATEAIVSAWRVFAMGRYARDAPNSPVEEVLTAAEREVILTVVGKR